MRFLKIPGWSVVGPVVLIGGLAVAGCGGGDSGGSNNPDGATPTNPIGQVIDSFNQTPTPPSETVVIKVTDNAFEPDRITVKRGTVIRWEWEGSNPHSIMVQGTTSPEQTEGFFERVMDQPGVSLAYQCGVHGSAMAGRIIVE